MRPHMTTGSGPRRACFARSQRDVALRAVLHAAEGARRAVDDVPVAIAGAEHGQVGLVVAVELAGDGHVAPADAPLGHPTGRATARQDPPGAIGAAVDGPVLLTVAVEVAQHR